MTPPLVYLVHISISFTFVEPVYVAHEKYLPFPAAQNTENVEFPNNRLPHNTEGQLFQPILAASCRNQAGVKRLRYQ